MKRLTFFRARILLLALGAVFAVSQTAVAWQRGAAPSEVLAPALYLPIFVGAIFWFIPGGLISSALSSLLYALVLADQSEALGLRLFVGLLVGRLTTYVFYGLVVAVATRYIESRLAKLEIYDQIDDLTGLYNSKFFLDATQLEIERAKRYRTLFCVSEVDISREAFEGMSRKRYERTIRDLARQLEQGHRLRFDDPFHRRQTDLPIRVDDGERDRFFTILPETPPQGAQIWTDKIQRAAVDFLTQQGIAADARVTSRVVAFPEGDVQGWDAGSETLNTLREEVQRVEDQRRVISE